MYWFWPWLLFVFFLLALPLAYGWGYRGWGPPYPSAYRRRRVRAAAPAGRADPAFNPAVDPVVTERSEWGLLDDLLWAVLAVAVLWLFLGLLL